MTEAQKYLHLTLHVVLSGALSITTQTANAQIDKTLLERVWVAIDSRPEGDDWISPITGAIIYFRNGNGELTHIGSDSTRSFDYELKKSAVSLTIRLNLVK